MRSLKARGVTIILTTHYIDEAEEMADRIGVISKGELILVEDKVELMRKLGKKQLTLQLQNRLAQIPPGLADISPGAVERRERAGLYLRRQGRAQPASPRLLEALDAAGISFKDLHTTQSSLEDIFVNLVREDK